MISFIHFLASKIMLALFLLMVFFQTGYLIINLDRAIQHAKKRDVRALTKKLLKLREQSLPKFIIVGAQKCGTSILREFLLQHPQLSSTNTPESHYFSFMMEKGEKWYIESFSNVTEVEKKEVD